jgi:glucose/arabinose dehydrogenase
VGRCSVRWASVLSLLVGLFIIGPVSVDAGAATLPTGFTETQVASSLSNPTAMAFAPDGRLFVCLQGGEVRVIRDGTLLSTPFLTVTVNASGERGLLGIAFDPNFAMNNWVYVYYTATTPTIHNRVSRFTASGDVAVAGSETILLELDDLSSATNHNGGALHFGADGKLYVAVGENATPSNSQTLSNLLGKILRIDPSGAIPTDNPFYTQTTGRNRAIWALGLRNPFTFAFDPFSGRMFINDVGQNTYEEINEGFAGVNYGWPESEGPTANINHRGPIYCYSHTTASNPNCDFAPGHIGCAITGGAFYNPSVGQFPPEYVGDYFFADYCSGWINRFDPSTSAVTGFASGISSPVDLQLGPDGSLYYLARGSTGVVYRIHFTGNEAPNITQQPQSQTVPAGQPVTFTVSASGTPPLSYRWQRNQVDIPGATSPSYTIASVTAGDNGARFRCVVSNAAGTASSNEAILTVTGNAPPTATITQPAAGSVYTAGTTITYAGTGNDPEDGSLPASAFTWQVDFHHNDNPPGHVHPFIQPTSGATGGSFTIPNTGETSANVFYRIYLTVTDSAGSSTTTFRDVVPRTVTVTLSTQRSGLQLTLDGQPSVAPLTFVGVVGMLRTIGALSPQTAGGGTYTFRSWSDGGAATHEITTPPTATTYTARYRRTK